jgi:hypothetical protein
VSTNTDWVNILFKCPPVGRLLAAFDGTSIQHVILEKQDREKRMKSESTYKEQKRYEKLCSGMVLNAVPLRVSIN